MAGLNQDFVTYAGNSYSKTFQAIGDDGNPLDILNATQIIWQASRDATSAPVLQKTLGSGVEPVNVSPSQGHFTLQLNPADTQNLSGFYMHQAIVTLPSGQVTTVILGRFQVGRVPAASYSGDPNNSPRDRCRFYLQDTNPEAAFLTDPEVDQLLATYSNPIRAAAAGARALAMRYAIKADKAVGDFRISYGQISKNFRDMAAYLESQGNTMGILPYSGGISWSDRQLVAQDTDRVKPPFKRDQFDNPRPGNVVSDTGGGGWDDPNGGGPS